MGRRAESIANELLAQLVANGGSVFASQVVVNEPSDLTGLLDSTKVYFIDGDIDMGSESIVVPEGGLSIVGFGFNISRIRSSADNHTLFVGPAGAEPGDLFLDGIEMIASGTNSKVFDLDNVGGFNAVEIIGCNFTDCTSLGELTAYRQLFASGCALIRCLDGITFSGTMAGGIRVDSSILIEAGTQFQGSVLKAGTALLIQDSVKSDFNGLALTGGSFCDFAPANIQLDGGFSIQGSRMPVAIDAFPNMPANSVKARFRDTQGTPKTYPGAVATLSAGGTNVIAAAGTYVDLVGTADYSELTWFSQFGSNGFEYDSSQEIDFFIDGVLEFTGGTNDQMAVQVWKYTAATTTWAAISPAFRATLSGGASGVRAENLAFGAFGMLQQGDRLQVRVANLTDTTNIETVAGGQIRIKER